MLRPPKLWIKLLRPLILTKIPSLVRAGLDLALVAINCSLDPGCIALVTAPTPALSFGHLHYIKKIGKISFPRTL